MPRISSIARDRCLRRVTGLSRYSLQKCSVFGFKGPQPGIAVILGKRWASSLVTLRGQSRFIETIQRGAWSSNHGSIIAFSFPFVAQALPLGVTPVRHGGHGVCDPWL